MDNCILLISNGFLPVPKSRATEAKPEMKEIYLGTVLSNLAYYGFVPAPDTVRALVSLTTKELGEFWKQIEPAVKNVTGADRNMADFVVYKNFPKEVLEMSRAHYWFNQILMYIGTPNEWFTQSEEQRPELKEKVSLKVLALGTDDTPHIIFENLCKLPTRWTDSQKDHAFYLYGYLMPSIDVDAFGFKENAILLAVQAVDGGRTVKMSTATDVLRLAVGLSGGDVSLRTSKITEAHRALCKRILSAPVRGWGRRVKPTVPPFQYGTKFAKFNRSKRKFLLALLENCVHLVDDFYLRPEVWKKLLRSLRPGDYNFPRVSEAYDILYRGVHKTFAGMVEYGIAMGDPVVLESLRTRPGEFMRRLHKTYAVFGGAAVDAFVTVVPKLSTMQLLKLDGYLSTINNRTTLIAAPKGNWTRAQIRTNSKVKIDFDHLRKLRAAISRVIASRLDESYPAGFNVDCNADRVKLQTNDQKLAPYGRGTVFEIPAEMNFVRVASYWKQVSTTGRNIWFDNGVNFFDESWVPVGACCWSEERFPVHGGQDWNRRLEITEYTAAIFSGDPTTSKEIEGRGCQMIDLYLDKLAKQGVRYAVWNILSYSSIKFDDAEDVLATIQWGVNAEAGALYEPSRAQMVFPIKGANLTKYIAYIDVMERKAVYIDANLYGSIRSAAENGGHLQEKLPAFLEYLSALPSVADVFVHGKPGTIPVVYSDAEVMINGGPAYVFVRQNAANEFEPIEVANVVGD
jgi:hypothetical protein